MQKYGFVLEEKKILQTIFQRKETFLISKFFKRKFFYFGKVFTKWFSDAIPKITHLFTHVWEKHPTLRDFTGLLWGFRTPISLLPQTHRGSAQTKRRLHKTNCRLVWNMCRLVFAERHINLTHGQAVGFARPSVAISSVCMSAIADLRCISCRW